MRRIATIATVVLIVAAFVGLVIVFHHADDPPAASGPAPLSAPDVGATIARTHLISVDRHSIAVPGNGWGAVAFVDGLNCRPCLRAASALGRKAHGASTLRPVLVDVNGSDGKPEIAALSHRTGWPLERIVLDTPDNQVASKFDVETVGTVLVWRPGGTIIAVMDSPKAGALDRVLQPAISG